MNKISEKSRRIKALYASGSYTQEYLAQHYNITQSRVSAILSGRKPMYRYCHTCGIRMRECLHVCPPCKEKNKKERETRSLEKKERRTREKEIQQRQRETRPRGCSKCDAPVERHKIFCDSCKKKYEYINRCGICGRLTKSAWNVCDVCIPNRALCTIDLEGRDRTRELVRIRDGFTCQDCGLIRTREYVDTENKSKKTLRGKIKSLDVHHLDGLCGKKSYKCDSAEDIPKLITLCHKCHFNRPEHKTKMKSKKPANEGS